MYKKFTLAKHTCADGLQSLSFLNGAVEQLQLVQGKLVPAAVWHHLEEFLAKIVHNFWMLRVL
jgi:hypothetical protein